jgi:superfamily I DNA/RNA helicase
MSLIKRLTFQETALSLTEQIWQCMINPNDPFPLVHDAYLKLYQLRKPKLKKYNTLLFDEAQDANPVITDIVFNQKCQLILVGDPHQQIYRWRGAEDALNRPELGDADVLYLTQSFRFGPQIAKTANAVLKLKGETIPLLGHDQPDEVLVGEESMPNAEEGHYSILHRSIVGTLHSALKLAEKRKKLFWIGGIEAYELDYLVDLYWFSRKNRGSVKNKKLFEEFEDYQNFVKIARESDDHEMNRAINIIERFKDIPRQIRTLRDLSTLTESEADVTLSTTHKAKGLEWQTVVIAHDYPDLFEEKMSESERLDELNLLYVAATRARQKLVINNTLQQIQEITTEEGSVAKNH